VFRVCLWSRAVPVTPRERLGALTERPSRDVQPSRDLATLGLPVFGSRGDMQVCCALRPATLQPADCHRTGIQVPLLLDASRRHAGDRAIPLLSNSWKWAPFIPQDTHSFHDAPKPRLRRMSPPFPATTHALSSALMRSS
jgi:hypothetical protein